MNRRTFLATVGTAGLAGCATGGSDGERTVNPALRGTPTPTPTATPTPTPYGAAAADALETPRDVVIGNRRLDDLRLRLRVHEGGTGVLDRTVGVPGGSEIRLARLFGAARTYTVRATTADGRDRELEWTPDEVGGDLGVDVGATVRSFDSFEPRLASAFVAEPGGDLVSDADGSSLLVVDNPGTARRVELIFADGAGSTAADLAVPARSRLTVPVSVPRSAVRLLATVEGATTTDAFRWQPLADGTLVLRVGDRPRFLCDLLARDLRVRNDLASAATLSVGVTADDERRFAGSFTLAGGGVATAAAAVPPASTYAFDVTVDGETERVDWAVCPPVGPVVVRLGERGVAVTVTPLGPSS
ncbi:hypothetical protein ACFQL9_14450 [Halobaculum lipolyticum]|uniref:Ig-like domain-containing protein n=1 Tax=Halobaculum lipolyticum TaxID=3032001 RepID=A0ABD5WGE8_9EURY